MDKFDVHIVKVILASLSTFFKIFQEGLKSERRGPIESSKRYLSPLKMPILLFTLLHFGPYISLLCWRLLFRKRLLKQKLARECDQVNAIDIGDRIPMISASACIYLYLGTSGGNLYKKKLPSDYD